jgi:hypothetical protein
VNDDSLRSALRRAAAEHQPDRTVMLNRIAANRSGASRGTRMALSALAVVTVLLAGGVARWALADSHPSSPSPPAAVAPPSPPAAVAPPPSATPSPSGAPSPSLGSPPSSARASHSPSRSGPASVVRGHPGDTQVEKGTLWSDGSVEPASTSTAGRSDVTLKASSPLSALDLTIRVTLTDGLASQGAVTVSGVRATVTKTGGALLYRFVLASGRTLPAGTYLLAGRYTHARGGRDAGQDTYEAYATDGLHKRPHVYGNFSPTS